MKEFYILYGECENCGRKHIISVPCDMNVESFSCSNSSTCGYSIWTSTLKKIHSDDLLELLVKQ